MKRLGLELRSGDLTSGIKKVCEAKIWMEPARRNL